MSPGSQTKNIVHIFIGQVNACFISVKDDVLHKTMKIFSNGFPQNFFMQFSFYRIQIFVQVST